jgi:hypothetical protein
MIRKFISKNLIEFDFKISLTAVTAIRIRASSKKATYKLCVKLLSPTTKLQLSQEEAS